MNDSTTFFLAFTAVFALLGLSLLRLERRAKALEARLRTLEAAEGKHKDPKPSSQDSA
jgi:CcmD family protein